MATSPANAYAVGSSNEAMWSTRLRVESDSAQFRCEPEIPEPTRASTPSFPRAPPAAAPRRRRSRPRRAPPPYPSSPLSKTLSRPRCRAPPPPPAPQSEAAPPLATSVRERREDEGHAPALGHGRGATPPPGHGRGTGGERREDVGRDPCAGGVEEMASSSHLRSLLQPIHTRLAPLAST